MGTSAYTTTQTDPNNNLANSTITPGAGVDRYNIAKQQFSNYADSTAPAYQASIRDATAAAAGAGQLGSGQLRTSYGNLADQRNRQLQNAGNSFLTDALNGSIGDAYNNIGIAQQQQGFEADQQQNAFNQALQTGEFNNATQGQRFNQGVTQSQLQDQLTNSAANRSAQQFALGSTGNPSDLQLALSQLYGNQAGQAGSALSGMIGNTVANNAQNANASTLEQILAQLTGGAGTATNPTYQVPQGSGGANYGGLFSNSPTLGQIFAGNI